MKNPRIDIFGNERWYLGSSFNKIYHRMDGPAVEFINGTKEWYVYGELHRIDGPAVEWASGDKYWYINGYNITRINNIILFMENK